MTSGRPVRHAAAAEGVHALATKHPAPGPSASRQFHPGLGPLPHPHGTAFRVWAPHAEAVSVVGSFNGWAAEANPLEREETGCWYGDAPAAKPGDEYLYRVTHRGESFTRVDPRARALTDSKGNAVVHDPTFDWERDGFAPAPIESLVLYEMHVGTFNVVDGCGTLLTAAARLGHLADLGVNGVTLMPVTEFVGSCGWGYDMAHLYAVESSYGGPRALKEFVKAAHRQGIAVFLDIVYNHVGFEDNLLWRFDGWHEKNRGGIYFFQDDDRADTPWGARPDYGRPEVRDYLLDNVQMWLDEYRADGLRIDGTFHMRTASKTERGEGPRLEEGWSLLREITDSVRADFPRAILIAEDMRGDPAMTRPTSQEGAGFHCQWSDKFAKTSRMSDDAADRALLINAVRDALVIRFNDDPFQRVIFSESHDNAGHDGRIPATASPHDPQGLNALRRLMQAQAIVFTAPGVPQLFQGQELFDPQDFEFPNPHSLDLSRTEQFPGVLRFFRDLIKLRKNASGISAGLIGPHLEIIHADAGTGLLAWRRWWKGGPGDDVLVVANLSHEPQKNCALSVPSPGRWQVRLDTASEGYGPSLGSARSGRMNAKQDLRSIDISLGPWGTAILSQDPE